MTDDRMEYKPSYLREQRNSCATCVGFIPNQLYPISGRCAKDNSLQCGEIVDTVYRCPAFQRKEDSFDAPKTRVGL